MVKQNDVFQYRKNRLATFTDGAKVGNSRTLRKWSLKLLDINILADSGFYYTPTKSYPHQITCFWCGKKEKNVEETTSIVSLHLINNPACPYSLIISNLKHFIMASNKSTFWQNLTASKSVPNSIIHPHSEESINLRRSTFKKLWKLDTQEECKVSSENLAQAGFYYSPVEPGSDRVICMYCDCPLEDWEPMDDPLQEHKNNSFAYCYFLDTIGKEMHNKEIHEKENHEREIHEKENHEKETHNKEKHEAEDTEFEKEENDRRSPLIDLSELSRLLGPSTPKSESAKGSPLEKPQDNTNILSDLGVRGLESPSTDRHPRLLSIKSRLSPHLSFDAFDFSIDDLENQNQGTIFKNFSSQRKYIRKTKKDAIYNTNNIGKKSPNNLLTGKMSDINIKSELKSSDSEPESVNSSSITKPNDVFSRKNGSFILNSEIENSEDAGGGEVDTENGTSSLNIVDSDSEYTLSADSSDIQASGSEKEDVLSIKTDSRRTKRRKTDNSKHAHSKRLKSQFSDDMDLDQAQLEQILNSPKKGRKMKVLKSTEDTTTTPALFDLSNQNIGDYDESNISFLEKDVHPIDKEPVPIKLNTSGATKVNTPAVKESTAMEAAMEKSTPTGEISSNEVRIEASEVVAQLLPTHITETADQGHSSTLSEQLMRKSSPEVSLGNVQGSNAISMNDPLPNDANELKNSPEKSNPVGKIEENEGLRLNVNEISDVSSLGKHQQKDSKVSSNDTDSDLELSSPTNAKDSSHLENLGQKSVSKDMVGDAEPVVSPQKTIASPNDHAISERHENVATVASEECASRRIAELIPNSVNNGTTLEEENHFNGLRLRSSAGDDKVGETEIFKHAGTSINTVEGKSINAGTENPTIEKTSVALENERVSGNDEKSKSNTEKNSLSQQNKPTEAEIHTDGGGNHNYYSAVDIRQSIKEELRKELKEQLKKELREEIQRELLEEIRSTSPEFTKDTRQDTPEVAKSEDSTRYRERHYSSKKGSEGSKALSIADGEESEFPNIAFSPTSYQTYVNDLEQISKELSATNEGEPDVNNDVSQIEDSASGLPELLSIQGEVSTEIVKEEQANAEHKSDAPSITSPLAQGSTFSDHENETPPLDKHTRIETHKLDIRDLESSPQIAVRGERGSVTRMSSDQWSETRIIFKETNTEPKYDLVEKSATDRNRLAQEAKLNMEAKCLRTISLHDVVSEMQALADTIDYLAEVAATKQELHDDSEGLITQFIGAMPEEEECMAVKEWMLHNASTCGRTVREIAGKLIRAYEEQFEELIHQVEELETTD